MKRKKTGRRWRCLWVLALLFCLSLPVSAEEGMLPEMPEEYGAVRDHLPEDVVQALPEGMMSEDLEEQGQALEEMLSPAYWLSMLSQMLERALGGGLASFATLCGLLLLAAVLRTLQSSLSSEGLGRAVHFCSTGAIFASLLHLQYTQLEAVAQFFERLHALMLAMIPVGGTVLAMGGNVSTAAANTATMSFFLTVSETLCAKSVVPVTTACTSLILCRSLSPDSGLGGLHNAIRKVYTFVLGFVMTLMTTLLSTQTTLCAAADSTGARAARLVSSTVIPIVGGAVGDTLRTVATGVQYLKSVVGIGGILFLALLVLPTLLSLLVTRLMLLLSGGVAEMLGCEQESRLLSELGGVWGIMIAVVAMTSVMFLLALAILVRVTVAAA